MAVEILILSGARQGEQLVLDQPEFRAGSDAACEILFDSHCDTGAAGRCATFRLQDDGWYVRGDVFVNERLLTGLTRIRSGDVVRMSRSGPDFSFGIVANATVSSHTWRTPSFSSTDFDVESVANGGRQEVPATVGPGLRTIARAAPARFDRRWIIGLTAALALGMLFFVALRDSNPPADFPGQTGEAVAAPLGVAPPLGVALPVQVAPPVESKLQRTDATAVAEKATASGPAPAANAAVGVEEAVFLVQVEKSSRSWPFATCVAIGGDTLITTAREAAQLAAWREHEHFRIWVTRPATGFREEVREIRVDAMFATLAEKPNDWIYFNVGVITVADKLPSSVALASPDQLARVEEGTPVRCVGFTHEGEKATRFDKFEPRLTQGKVYVITAEPSLPTQPRLLHIRADIPKNAYGSPVVDAEGNLLGLYGEAAAPPSEKGATGGAELKNMHYVTVVNPQTISLWLRDRNEKLWVSASSAHQDQPVKSAP